MRLPGISEIILILIVATVVIFAVRIMGAPPRRTGDSAARYRDAEEEERRYEERVKQTRRSRIQLMGVVAILAGVVIFLSSLNLIKWVFWGPVGALIIIAIGIITIFAVRRR